MGTGWQWTVRWVAKEIFVSAHCAGYTLSQCKECVSSKDSFTIRKSMSFNDNGDYKFSFKICALFMFC